MTDRPGQHLMWLHCSTSDFVIRDQRESWHVKHSVKQPREAVMTPAEGELKGERRTGTGVTGQENLSPSGLVLFLLLLLLLFLLLLLLTLLLLILLCQR